MNKYDSQIKTDSSKISFTVSLENISLCNTQGPVYTTLDLPASDEQIDAALADITDLENDEYEISNYKDYPFGEISDFTDIKDLNLTSKIIRSMSEIQIAAVTSYLDMYKIHDQLEIMNVCLQVKEINFLPYQFDGIENVPNFSKEEKFGYTIATNNKLLEMLEGTCAEDYFDFEPYGKSIAKKYGLTLYEKGALDPYKINTHRYTLDEINELITNNLNQDDGYDITDLAKQFNQIKETLMIKT